MPIKTNVIKNVPFTILNNIPSKFFYGWIVVFAVFMIGGTAAGIIYSFPVFFDSIAETHNASRAQVAFVFSICEFIWFTAGFAGGYLSDKFGTRIVVLVGSLTMATGLAFAASSSSLYILYFSYGAGVGVGGGLMYIPAISIVQRWFKRRRGLASGLAICGTGVGTLVFPFLASKFTDSVGWVNTHYIFSGLVLIICATASFTLANNPVDMGLAPDGDAPELNKTSVPTAIGVDLKDAILSRPFWHLYIASLLSSSAVFTTYVHLVPYSLDHQNSTSGSIALIGILGVASILGRFLFGGLADRIGGRYTLSVMFLGLSVSMFWWLISVPDIVNLMIYALTFGLFYGGYITILPALSMNFFGGRKISTIIGCLYTSWGFGALLGPTVSGYIFDVDGSYFYAILLGIILLSISVISCLTINDPAHDY